MSVAWRNNETGLYLYVKAKATHTHARQFGDSVDIDDAYVGLDVSQHIKQNYKPVQVHVQRTVRILEVTDGKKD